MELKDGRLSGVRGGSGVAETVLRVEPASRGRLRRLRYGERRGGAVVNGFASELEELKRE